MINFYMFEKMFDFIEPVLTVFTAIAVITVAAVVCIGCIALAFKAGDSFKGMLKERYSKCRSKWKNRVTKLADYLGEKVGATISFQLDKIFNLPTKASVESDLRGRMVGKWISENDDELVITEENGLFMMSVRYREARVSENYLIGLSNIPNNRSTLFLAEGDMPMTIGLTDKQDVIYFPNSNRKFHRTSKSFPSEIQEELDKVFTAPPVVFSSEPSDENVFIKPEIKARILEICGEESLSSGVSFDEIEDAVNNVNRNIIE